MHSAHLLTICKLDELASPHHTITRTEHHQVVRACHVTIKEDEPKYDATEGGPRGGGRPLREGEGERDARWP